MKYKQTVKNRLIHNNLKAHFSLDRLYYELYKKKFKKTYKGKPTKKYLQLMVQIQKVERVRGLFCWEIK